MMYRRCIKREIWFMHMEYIKNMNYKECVLDKTKLI